MVFIISTVIIFLIVLLALWLRDGRVLIFTAFPILLGYGLVGMEAKVKETKTRVEIYYDCSEIRGNCRVGIKDSSFQVSFLDDYKTYKLLIDSSYSEAILVEGFNSYGKRISDKLIIR